MCDNHEEHEGKKSGTKRVLLSANLLCYPRPSGTRVSGKALAAGLRDDALLGNSPTASALSLTEINGNTGSNAKDFTSNAVDLRHCQILLRALRVVRGLLISASTLQSAQRVSRDRSRTASASMMRIQYV